MKNITEPGQLSFEALLQETDTANVRHEVVRAEAESANARRELFRASAHLPATYREAVPFYRTLLGRHHDAMLAGDAAEAIRLRGEAELLGIKLNNPTHAILGDDDTRCCCLLERATQAPKGEVPLWGQTGSFEVTVRGARLRISMEGIFGIASDVYHWLGFSTHAVGRDRPSISETGYRSFVAVGSELEPGYTPDRFAAEVIAAYLDRENGGRLVAIKPAYRHRRARP